MTLISGATFIAETLQKYDVTHVFYVESMLRKSLVEMQRLGIKRVVTHSEKAAAYMADGYARVSNKPGVCMAQSVGAANLAAGLQDPFLAHSPVIALTGYKPAFFQYRNAYQEIPHHPLFECVTKYNVRIDDIEQLPIIFRQAFRETTSSAPRPAHIDIKGHNGELTDEAEAELKIECEATYKQCPSSRPVPSEKDMKKAADVLLHSKRPVLVVGRGAAISGAGKEIVALAEKLQIPVASSADGKGVMPDTNPLCVGVVGDYSRSCANQIVSESDLVVFIGTGTGDQVTKNWTIPEQGIPIIHIDINPSELGRNYPNTLGLLGDARATLQAMAEMVGKKRGPSDWTKQTDEIMKQWWAKAEKYRNAESTPIRPERICKEISDLLPDDGIIVADTGHSAIWASTMINITSPNQSFIRAAGSLGWAFPASLGAKCAAPQRPVVCFCGDGGFLYHMSELETASRWNINTITVVNNNSMLGQCAVGIEKTYDNNVLEKEHLYKFQNTNFARIAAEFGCIGIQITDPEEIRPALQEAFNARRPVLIDVITDGLAEPAL